MHDGYLRRWQERLDGYEAQRLMANADAGRSAEAAARAMAALPAGDWTAPAAALIDVADRTRHAFSLLGREETLRRFALRMQDEPSPSAAGRWLAREAADLKDRARAVERRSRDLTDRLDKPVTVSRKWVRAVEALAAEQGLVQGTAQELQALETSTGAYYVDIDADDAEALHDDRSDRKRAASLLGLTTVIGGEVYRQTLIAALSRPRRCTTEQSRVVCS